MKPQGYDFYEVNESDGQKFYGYDNGDGTTDWYTENDMLDCRTATPHNTDDEDDC
ncbi:hypothetical protein LAV60_15585 [Clostridium sporogenes]|uniref:hypothetical protein n=1 Tax=Clostridium sporogenes TaxID=1509 RepID=UPI002236F50E|nr:hypothetical protein [Clostridium sporogenes]MCW6094593.1 hypothetical protein [Clostridium sporogenes]